MGGVRCTRSIEENPRAWLTESTASPALERGQYEKQMDHYWSCGSERVAWRSRSIGEFLQSAQMDQKGPEPDGKRTARCEPAGRQEGIFAGPSGSASPQQLHASVRG